MIIETLDKGDIVFFVHKDLWTRGAVVRKNLKIRSIQIDLSEDRPIITYSLVSEKLSYYTAYHYDLYKTLKEANEAKQKWMGYRA